MHHKTGGRHQFDIYHFVPDYVPAKPSFLDRMVGRLSRYFGFGVTA